MTTNVPGCKDVVVEEKNGLVVPAKDHISLARAIDRIGSDPTLARQMGVAGREIVKSRFSSSVVNEQTLALYSQLQA